MNIWKTKVFKKWQKKTSILNTDLLSAITEISKGLVDADLGNGLIKKRVARKGSGKKSGYRTLIATNKQEKWFFIYGFSKNERENINQQELNSLQELAKTLIGMTIQDIEKAMINNELEEMKDEKQNT